MNNIEQSICEAIEIICERAISQAQYDKTIQATIIKCIDKTIGKYLVQYQDSSFYAYAGSSEITYGTGAEVYILVPGNDLSKEKTILGTSKKLGLNYIATMEDDSYYQITGNNCISQNTTISLSSYREGKYVSVLYDAEQNPALNKIDLNLTSVDEYIRDSNSSVLICGAAFQTGLKLEQQFRGNYGLLFALDFIDNSTNETVTRYYTVDVNKMEGNPYKLIIPTRQYGIFAIDGANFVRVKQIAAFCYGFPNSLPEDQLIPDIWISAIELCGAERLDADDINNYCLTFVTRKGTYFDEDSPPTDTLPIEAQVKIKGQVVDVNSQKLEFYWFIEDNSIGFDNQYYNKYGGAGWRCLNIAVGTDYLTGENIYYISKNQVLGKQVKIKCTAVYNDVSISRVIAIKNLSSPYEVTIESDSGTAFYFDQGRPSLTCKVSPQGEYTYVWCNIDSTGTFTPMTETTAENESYVELYNYYVTLLEEIKSGIRMPEATRSELERTNSLLASYNYLTRVEDNRIYNIDMSLVDRFVIYRCSAYREGVLVGTAEIILTNSLTIEGQYHLVIDNGSVTYKYDENGAVPAQDSMALGFSLYDNLGNRIEDSVMQHCPVTWFVPIEHTMITANAEKEEPEIIDGYYVYRGFMELPYTIARRYNPSATNNTIKLKIQYKSMVFNAETNLIFIKEGENGTNGTDYYCKIVPNSIVAFPFDMLPMITELPGGNYEPNFQPKRANQFFKVQFWHNGVKIYDDVPSGATTEGTNVNITWSILRNNYKLGVSDESSLSVDAATGIFTFSGYKEGATANIIKVTLVHNGVTYFALLPLTTAKLDSSGFNIFIKNPCGFQEVMYSPDGKTPKYDSSNPFAIEIRQDIDGFSENVTNRQAYSWSVNGSIYERGSWVASKGIKLVNSEELDRWEQDAAPADSYDGQCVTDSIECAIDGVGKIKIPVYRYLNRYGQSALNDWDGNSISLNEEEGFILAPQVGAGMKEKDNSFTGVLIGSVKESSDSGMETGLLGYSKGARSVFIDASTGTATFGTRGKGQIILDPTNNTAELKSGNYSTADKTGMKIDLTTPEIRFGSGDFIVDASGHILAKGGGTIAGWSIDDDSLFTGSRKDTTTNVRLSSADFTRRINGTEKTNIRMAFNNNFAVTSEGEMIAAVGIIGSGSSKITIGRGDTNNSALFSGTKNSLDAEGSGFYLGTDGFSLGSNFKVTRAGELTAKSGTIGGWIINSSQLSSSTEGVVLNPNGIIYAKMFNMDSGYIGNWRISGDTISCGKIIMTAKGATKTWNRTTHQYDYTEGTGFMQIGKFLIGQDEQGDGHYYICGGPGSGPSTVHDSNWGMSASNPIYSFYAGYDGSNYGLYIRGDTGRIVSNSSISASSLSTSSFTLGGTTISEFGVDSYLDAWDPDSGIIWRAIIKNGMIVRFENQGSYEPDFGGGGDDEEEEDE